MPDPADHADNPNRNVVDRRLGTDRRRNSDPNYTGPERRQAKLQADADADRRSGLERRRGAGIRREEDRRSAEEGEMTAEQYEFIRAIETYKKVNKKLFPTWTEVLEVMEQLGYRKVEPRSIDLPGVPDPLAGENTRKPTDLPLGDTEDIEPEAEAA
ncbi:MAG: hypothetical protein AAF743_10040 [Planctomycetota bacterium]